MKSSEPHTIVGAHVTYSVVLIREHDDSHWPWRVFAALDEALACFHAWVGLRGGQQPYVGAEVIADCPMTNVSLTRERTRVISWRRHGKAH